MPAAHRVRVLEEFLHAFCIHQIAFPSSAHAFRAVVIENTEHLTTQERVARSSREDVTGFRYCA